MALRPPNNDKPIFGDYGGYSRYFYTPEELAAKKAREDPELIALLDYIYDYVAEIRRDIERIQKDGFYKYSPSQPRVPAGNPDGGEWTDGGGGGSSTTPPHAKPSVLQTLWQETFGGKPAYAEDMPGMQEATGKTPPLPAYRAQTSKTIQKEWEDFHGNMENLVHSTPTEKRVYGEIFAAEGGMQIAPNGATAGILPAALNDVKATASTALAQKLEKIKKPQDLAQHPELVPEVYRGYFDFALSKAVGSASLDTIKNDNAAAALADTLFMHGRSGGAIITIRAVNTILAEEGKPIIKVEPDENGIMPTIVVGQTTLSAYKEIVKSGRTGDLLDAMASSRVEYVIIDTKKEPSEGEKTRFEYFKFKDKR